MVDEVLYKENLFGTLCGKCTFIIINNMKVNLKDVDTIRATQLGYLEWIEENSVFRDIKKEKK